MTNQRIIWFQDSLKLTTTPNAWPEIDLLTQNLIGLIGRSDFEHVIVDPMRLLEQLHCQLNLDDFSVVVDLSGFISREIRHTTQRPVIKDFHLSRLRKLSSPRLDGVGHLVSLDNFQRGKLRQKFDFSRPLFIDDVCWSGKTALLAAQLLEVNPAETSFGFLSLNEGNFGTDSKGKIKLGGKHILESRGFRIFAGGPLATPLDDGFHVKDFISNKALAYEEVFAQLVRLAFLRDVLIQAKTENQRQQVKKEINSLVQTNQQLFFQDGTMTGDLLARLQAEGRAICPNGVGEEGIFGVEPSNLLMPSFLKRTDPKQLADNAREIVRILQEFQRLLSEDQELRREENMEFMSRILGLHPERR